MRLYRRVFNSGGLDSSASRPNGCYPSGSPIAKRVFGPHVLAPDSRNPSPTRPDRFQQFVLAGAGISKNGHNYHRQDFGVPAQGVHILVGADLIEHAFANSQIVRTEAGAIEMPTQHLCEPFRTAARCGGLLLINR